MVYSEDDLLPISALQHLIFCERQCALIHIEQAWAENMFTAEGRVLHEKSHDEERAETRDGVHIERGMALRSLRLGLIGKADVVEFHRDSSGRGWLPFPVEYKRGKPKADDDCDKVQLCAQAICLEEMMGLSVADGALYYGRTHHRLDVVFDNSLRRETEDTAGHLHEFIRAGQTPKPVYTRKCESCSLIDVCMPKKMSRGRSVREYLREITESETKE